MQKLPRGVRNNNPGNIDWNKANNWLGQVGIEGDVANPRFAKFDKPENGIRAIAKLLINYHRKGFNTVGKMINRWAPPTENQTVSYARRVARDLGVEVNTVLTLNLITLEKLVVSVIEHENGYNPYSPAVITDGVRSAF